MTSTTGSSYCSVAKKRIQAKIAEIKQLKTDIFAGIELSTAQAISEAQQLLKFDDRKKFKAGLSKANGILESCVLRLTQAQLVILQENNESDESVSDIENLTTSLVSAVTFNELVLENSPEHPQVQSMAIDPINVGADTQGLPSLTHINNNSDQTGYKSTTSYSRSTLNPECEPFVIKGEANINRGPIAVDCSAELSTNGDSSHQIDTGKIKFKFSRDKSSTVIHNKLSCFEETENVQDIPETADFNNQLQEDPSSDRPLPPSSQSVLMLGRFDIGSLEPELDEPSHSFTALLAVVIDPTEFYVYPVMDGPEQIDILASDLRATYANSAPPLILDPEQQFVVGSHWCCRSPKDKYWYRGRIIETKNLTMSQSKQKMEVKVQYIDYGDSAWINTDDLRILQLGFCRLPALAVKCRLDGEERLELQFNSLVDKSESDEHVDFQVVDKVGDSLCVRVYDKENDSNPLNTEKNCGERASISESECNALDSWNPMEEDYYSPRNSYKVDIDDAGVALTGYKALDESQICVFYRRGQFCRRGNECRFKHINPSNDGKTTDTKLIPSVPPQIDLPRINTCVAVEVTAIRNPSQFWVNFPLGTTDHIDEIEDKDFQLPPLNLYHLVDYMQTEYKDTPDRQGDYLRRAIGEIVVAKCSLDNRWYRAIVLDTDEVNGTVAVSFVDYGSCQIVPENNIRDIKSKFLHLPLQAVECFLHGLKPDGDKWSDGAIKLFTRLTLGQNTVAEVVDIVQDKMIVKLFGVTASKQRFDIARGLLIQSDAHRDHAPSALNKL